MGRIQEGLLGWYSSLPTVLRTSALASHLEVTVKQTHSLMVTNSSQFTQDFLDFYDWISSVLRIPHSSRKIRMVGPSECPKKAVWRISELTCCVSFLGLLEQIPPTEWLKTTQNYSHSSEGCTSKTKMSPARSIPSGGSEEDCARTLSSLPVVCWQSLAFFGLQRHHSDLCLHLHVALSPCMGLCLNFPFVKLYWVRGSPHSSRTSSYLN